MSAIEPFSIVDYVSVNQVPRSKIFLPRNLVSFLGQGEKVVHYANDKTTVTNSQFALLSSGNCLMTEKLPVNNSYRSKMLFFDDSALAKFFIKYAAAIDRIPVKSAARKPFLVGEQDAFIKTFMASLQLIQAKPPFFSERLIALKFEELMLHLLEQHPEEVRAFQLKKREEYADFEIRKAVESNITGNLTLDELAFLCNMSVSTFKRKFVKLYNATPGRYFLHQKMELAKSLLLQNENPGEVCYKVGYENHSSFSQSFRQVYGMSPKQFQQQH